MTISQTEVGEETEGYHPVKIATDRGDVEGQYYLVEGATSAAVWVPGAGGGYYSPARGLYPGLCEDLRAEGIASLRLPYRRPNNLHECTLDVLAGLAFLRGEGIQSASVAGHSFGGAVVIQAGAASNVVRTVIALSSQTHGAGPARLLAPRCSLLLVHGLDDNVLPPYCSQAIYNMAGEPKKLLFYENTGHSLDEAAEPIYAEVRAWLVAALTAGSGNV